MIPAVLLFFWTGCYDQWVLPKIALASVLVLVAWFSSSGFKTKELTWPLLAMFACVCVSAALSGDPTVNVFGRYMSRYLGVLPLAVCLLAYHLPRRDVDRSMRVAAAGLSVYALSQLVWSPLGYNVLSTGSRVPGSLGSPPALGCALAMCLPFVWRKRWITLLTLAALFATGSRGAILAGAVAIVALLALNGTISLRKRWLWLLIPGIAAPFLFHHGTSDAIRWHTWAASLKMWRLHPWLGCGAESYIDTWRQFRDPAWLKLVGLVTFQDHAHNDVLEALAAFGSIGAAAYAFLVYRTWQTVKRFPQVAAAFIAVFICAKFNAVPFAVLFVLALLAGSLEAPAAPGAGPHRVELCRVVAVLCTLYAVWFFYADCVFYRARRVLDFPGVMRAVELNPYELFYKAHEADLLLRKYDYDRDPALIGRALDLSREALREHPGSVQARHALTLNLVILAQVDPHYLAEAAESAEILVKLDPRENYRFKVVSRTGENNAK